MSGQVMAKRERVIEAVRHGLEGDAALAFIHESGFALTQAGIARHLRAMGGRGRIQELIAAGKSNREILGAFYPEEDLAFLPEPEPTQGDLFAGDETEPPPHPLPFQNDSQFETTKLTVRLPNYVYNALRIAARAEEKPQNQLLVEILTAALGNMPRFEGNEPTGE
ncbi:MAG: hypothetical protein ACLFTT_02610 [Candidatus Hydrogenedentota bacterium]